MPKKGLYVLVAVRLFLILALDENGFSSVFNITFFYVFHIYLFFQRDEVHTNYI